MTAVVIGIVFMILGAWGLLVWFHDFLSILRGFGPVSILIGGVVTFVSGVVSIRPKRAHVKK